jgi:Asp/Glu/hydantoin racemase
VARVLVVNPNSSVAVTERIEACVAPLQRVGDIRIDVVRLPEGPPGIQCQRDVEQVVQPLLARIEAEKADANVIACFSDPGLYAAREIAHGPVFGIAESAILTALSRGSRFGILAILPNSIPRHLRYAGAMGVLDRMAGDRALGLTVADLADADRTFDRLCSVGATLRDTDGADVLILGCAGMAHLRERLAEHLQIPVVEPTQAAVANACAAVTLGW